MKTSELLFDQRRQLCELLENKGPAFPTLNPTWKTLDLAAHLVLRETNPLAVPGIILGGPFGYYTQLAMQNLKETKYEDLVAKLRVGPPALLSVYGLSLINLVENWIHTQDILRVDINFVPPTLDKSLYSQLWKAAIGLGILFSLKSKTIALEIADLEGNYKKLRNGSDAVTLKGDPQELVLYFSGRKQVAQIEILGPNDEVEKVRKINFKL